MRHELDFEGNFICDCPDTTTFLGNWTWEPIPQPIHRPKFEGTRFETGEWVGSWIDLGPAPLTLEAIIELERAWRDEELAKADIEVNKALDADLPSLPLWKAYRQALRDWPEHPDFPDATKRPASPTTQ